MKSAAYNLTNDLWYDSSCAQTLYIFKYYFALPTYVLLYHVKTKKAQNMHLKISFKTYFEPYSILSKHFKINFANMSKKLK